MSGRAATAVRRARSIRGARSFWLAGLLLALPCALPAGTPGVAGLSGVEGMSALATDFRYCTTCHGARLDGNDAIRAPALAGIEPWYLAQRLRAYRSHQLGQDFRTDPAGTDMGTVAREVDDERIAGIARFVATYPAVVTAATVMGDARRGRQLYQQHCAACHGTHAEGQASVGAPALARLNDWYLLAAWEKYRAGLRGADGAGPSAQAMRALAGSLGDRFAIADLARYVQSLQRSPSP